MAKAIKKVKEETILEETAPIEEIKEGTVTNELIEEVIEQVKEATKPEGIKTIPPMEDIVLSEEERLLSYIANSHSEKIELNPFLKSLYPLPTFGLPPVYLQIGESKKIRVMLGDMQLKSLISLTDDSYKRLGSFYHEGTDQTTKHWNLDTLKIYAVKI
jgi:hypothetical protein